MNNCPPFPISKIINFKKNKCKKDCNEISQTLTLKNEQEYISVLCLSFVIRISNSFLSHEKKNKRVTQYFYCIIFYLQLSWDLYLSVTYPYAIFLLRKSGTVGASYDSMLPTQLRVDKFMHRHILANRLVYIITRTCSNTDLSISFPDYTQ